MPPGRTIWGLLYAGFGQKVDVAPEKIEVENVRIRRKDDDETNEGAGGEKRDIVLRYGQVPDGMLQRQPETGTPPPLEPGKQYFVAVMEKWDAIPRRFVFTVDEST